MLAGCGCGGVGSGFGSMVAGEGCVGRAGLGVALFAWLTGGWHLV